MEEAVKKLELFFYPNGTRKAQLSLWPVSVVVAPKDQYDELFKKEVDRCGIYIFFGDEGGEPTEYIGSGNIGKRLPGHKYRDWSTKVVFATASNEHFNEASVLYLEKCLLEAANKVNRRLLNKNDVNSHITDDDKSVLDEHKRQLLMILPHLGIHMFENKKRSAKQEKNRALKLVLKQKKGCAAKAVREDFNFTILKGSRARGEWAGAHERKEGKRAKEIRDKLESKGVLSRIREREEEYLEFTEDYSPENSSVAAQIITGRHANGGDEWYVEGTKKTLKKWENENS